MNRQSQSSHNPTGTISESPIEVLDFEHDRYSSLKLIPWWEQEKVAAAKVMVAGAGALGNEVLKNLALLGIGHIFVVDIDTIEASNLTRSVLFRKEDIGRLKAAVAAERVREMNPDVKLAAHNRDVVMDIGLGVFRRMDVVICCVDNVEARVFMNNACWKVMKPWINGGIEEMQGIVEVFVPPDGACYECTMTEIDYQEMNRRRPCGLPFDDIALGKVPTTPTISSIIAGIQVQEALKLIHGREVMSGGGISFYGTTNELLRTAYSRSEECPVHSSPTAIVPIDRKVGSTTFGQLLQEASGQLGEEARIEFDFDLVVGLSCSCGERQKLLGRRNALKRNQVMCSRCGEIMAMDLTSEISRLSTELMDKTLSQAGIAPFDIVTIKGNNAQLRFEFIGDEAEMLNYL
ncbi:MAG: ThiF family adenylyltransferase [Chloroflexi bacterium]|nr:ThiF family adenylyltransferase [Chloroflexota bacterium]